MAAQPAATVVAVMRGLVDYAGLFPPASLEMPDAVSNYAEYANSPDGWMLGSFVLGTDRLDELAARTRSLDLRSSPWCLSALVGADVESDAARIREFNRVHRDRLRIEAVECRAVERGHVAASLRRLPDDVTCYVEVPFDDHSDALLSEIAAAGARAKMRTGGVTANAFPRADDVARFIEVCASLELPFKATAGLHHPLCGVHALTYAPDSSQASMFGFLNVFTAAVFAHAGLRGSELVEIICEANIGSFAFTDDTIQWREHAVSLDRVMTARRSLGISFGSCSFREPVEGLHALALL